MLEGRISYFLGGSWAEIEVGSSEGHGTLLSKRWGYTQPLLDHHSSIRVREVFCPLCRRVCETCCLNMNHIVEISREHGVEFIETE